MSNIEHIDKINESIMKIVTYSDFFDFPLRFSEILNDLPFYKTTQDDTLRALNLLIGKGGVIVEKDGYYFLHGRGKTIELRNLRAKSTSALIKKHERSLHKLFKLPWVRTVAITGSAAFDNSDEIDDLDVFLIVKANRAWIVDLYNLFMIRLFNERLLKKPKTICVNYIIDEASLVLPEHDFFTAHQCAHMKPVYDEGIWESFVQSNQWMINYFPNVDIAKIKLSQKPLIKKSIEMICNIFGADILNMILYLFRGRRLKKKKKLGLVKGDYSLRRIKCNDSRSGAIVDLRLKQSVSDPDGTNLMREILNYPTVDPNEIRDLIPEENKTDIESMLDYFNDVKQKLNDKLSDETILHLPYTTKNNENSAIWKRRAKHLHIALGILRTIFSSANGPVLDLGSGNCWLSRRLIENGYETVSLDPMINSDWGLNKGDIFEKFTWVKLRRVRGIMENLPFADSSFKTVISSGSLHYTHDLKATIREIIRVLTNDGIALILDSPVFQNDHDGNQMIDARKMEFNTANRLNQLKLSPIWYINLKKLMDIASSLGLFVTVIPTRNKIERSFDRIKNVLTDNRRWAEMPLIMLSKSQLEKSNKKLPLLRMLRYYHYRLFIENKIAPNIEFKLNSISLKIDAGVFNPIPYDTSRILLDYISSEKQNLANESVLDMGTGSGIHAIHCACYGADVTAVDINPQAIINATQNAVRNDVDAKIRFVESDLFSHLKNEKFDLILFNPPFYKGEREISADYAWYDKNNHDFQRFIKTLKDYLSENGEALIILSDRMELATIEKLVYESDLSFQIRLSRRIWDETYKIYSVRRQNP